MANPPTPSGPPTPVSPQGSPGGECLVVLGAGNMGGAIARGVVRARLLRPASIILADPSTERLSTIAKELVADARTAEARAGVDVVGSGGGVGRAAAAGAEIAGPAVFARAPDAVRRGGPGATVLIAVKPQSFPALVADLRTVLGDDPLAGRLVISIMAGVTSAGVSAALGVRGDGAGASSVRVVRAMPNLGAMVGRSVTALCIGPGAGQGDFVRAERLLRSVGRVESIPESMMDAFTAVAGSGPAYVFYLAQALAEAAMAAGFDAPTSERLSRAVIEGSAQLMDSDPRAPAELRASVTSKGGTTEAAIAELEAAGVRRTLEQAVAAAVRRGTELSAAAQAPGTERKST